MYSRMYTLFVGFLGGGAQNPAFYTHGPEKKASPDHQISWNSHGPEKKAIHMARKNSHGPEKKVYTWPGKKGFSRPSNFLEFDVLDFNFLAFQFLGIQCLGIQCLGIQCLGISISWNSVSWNSVSWNSMSWNSISRNSIQNSDAISNVVGLLMVWRSPFFLGHKYTIPYHVGCDNFLRVTISH